MSRRRTPSWHDLESTRVRLLGIDTPEISSPPDCWGAEATAKLTALVPAGSTIWVMPDAEVHDQYGRTLLYVWTPDGRFVNGELVAQGDARVEVYSPNRSHEDAPVAREDCCRVGVRSVGRVRLNSSLRIGRSDSAIWHAPISSMNFRFPHHEAGLCELEVHRCSGDAFARGEQARQAKRNSTKPMSGSVPWMSAARR